MTHFSLAMAGLLFPGPIILGGLLVALRRQRQPVGYGMALGFLGLGLAALFLEQVWCVFAEHWLLGRFNLAFYFAFLTAALPEEGFRYLVIRCGLARREVSLVSAMCLGALVGLIFGIFEHVVYAFEKGWETWLLRSFTSVPYHTLSGAVLGYGVVSAKRTGRPWGGLLLICLVVLHGLADWPLLPPGSDLPATTWEEFVNSGWFGNVTSLAVVTVLAVVLTCSARQADLAHALSEMADST